MPPKRKASKNSVRGRKRRTRTNNLPLNPEVKEETVVSSTHRQTRSQSKKPSLSSSAEPPSESLDDNISALNSLQRSASSSEKGSDEDNEKLGSSEDDEFDDDFDTWEQVDLSPNKQEDKKDLHIVTQHITPQLTKESKKGSSSAMDKSIRLSIHIMHFTCLLYHGSVRNRWLMNSLLLDGLRDLLVEKQPSVVEAWVCSSQTHEDLLKLLNGLRMWWNKSFKIESHGLRKLGYRTLKQGFDIGFSPEIFHNFHEYQASLLSLKGSRDLAAQGFTALCRSLNLKARLIFSLQPLTFSTASYDDWSPHILPEETSTSIDDDLRYPIFWTEIYDQSEKKWIAVDAVVLNGVYTNDMTWFEPKGAYAESKHLRMGIVAAYDNDLYAKDVTLRYTDYQSSRLKKIRHVSFADKYFDFYKAIFGQLAKRNKDAEDIHEEKELESKVPIREPKSFADFKNHPEFVLIRHLRREEALLPNAKPVKTATFGNGKKATSEEVYLRKDVVICKTPENYHKEGRIIKEGEQPRKMVKARAVTISRKREHEFRVAETNEPVLQGLYSSDQTELYVPPPIKDGIIPKNGYGNMDCFVESMIPKGAAHLPYRGIAKIAKKLNIDYADAVTGFEFRKHRAIPVTTGIIVPEESAQMVYEEFLEYEKIRIEKQQMKERKIIYGQWKHLLNALRIRKRIEEQYA